MKTQFALTLSRNNVFEQFSAWQLFFEGTWIKNGKCGQDKFALKSCKRFQKLSQWKARSKNFAGRTYNAKFQALSGLTNSKIVEILATLHFKEHSILIWALIYTLNIISTFTNMINIHFFKDMQFSSFLFLVISLWI